MGRSRVRGIECAGAKLAIEVPSNWNWEWPDTAHAEAAVPPHDPDVFIGVRVAAPERPRRDVVRYASRGVRFEVGWLGDDWVVAVYGPGGIVRSARFDSDFGHGEIRHAPELAGGHDYPLSHPLEEQILFHRLLREGCLIVDARLRIERDGAHLFFDAPREGAPPFASGLVTSPRGSSLVLRPVLESRSGEPAGVWVFTTPWRQPGGEPTGGFLRSRVAQFHLMAGEEEDDVDTTACRPRKLTPYEAADAVLRHASVPMHDPHALDRIGEIVGNVVRRVPVSRMPAPAMADSPLLDWDAPETSLGFSIPAL